MAGGRLKIERLQASVNRVPRLNNKNRQAGTSQPKPKTVPVKHKDATLKSANSLKPAILGVYWVCQ